MMWRTGLLANCSEVRDLHGVAEYKQLLGWFYVGGADNTFRKRMLKSNRPSLNPHQFLGQMTPSPGNRSVHIAELADSIRTEVFVNLD